MVNAVKGCAEIEKSEQRYLCYFQLSLYVAFRLRNAVVPVQYIVDSVIGVIVGVTVGVALLVVIVVVVIAVIVVFRIRKAARST